jgi:hypothetical protein
LAWAARWLVQQAHVAAAGGWPWSGGVFAELLVFDFQDVHDAGEAFDRAVGSWLVRRSSDTVLRSRAFSSRSSTSAAGWLLWVLTRA